MVVSRRRVERDGRIAHCAVGVEVLVGSIGAITITTVAVAPIPVVVNVFWNGRNWVRERRRWARRSESVAVARTSNELRLSVRVRATPIPMPLARAEVLSKCPFPLLLRGRPSRSNWRWYSIHRRQAPPTSSNTRHTRTSTRIRHRRIIALSSIEPSY